MKFQIAHFIFQSTAGGPFKHSLWALSAILCWLVGCAEQNQPVASSEEGAMRIVSMAPNLTEILFALGLDEQIVGVTRHCNYPPAAQQKRRIGTFWQPDIEAVLARRPTLVVTLGFEQQRQLAERLATFDCKTLTLEIEAVSQLFDAILTIGHAVDRTAQAQTLVEQLQAAQERMHRRYAGRRRPKVLWVIQREPLRVAGTKTFVNELIELVGGVNAIGPTRHIYPPVGAEQILVAQPDVIVEPTDEPERLADQRRSAEAFYAAYASVPAVQNGRIYVLNGDVVSRLGPRLDQALEQIARCVWQE
ncbi:MAG TPA: hypothetical protein ENN97_01900 [Phycisphaerales bacterium]|nr:hypothetical protein [Phycisphaerales bacterium]